MEYRIKAGDCLSMIMSRFYGVGPGSPDYTQHLNQILALNPHIQNPDLIHAGTNLRLIANLPPASAQPAATIQPVTPRIPRNPSSAPHRVPYALPGPVSVSPQLFVLKDVPPADELDFWMLSWLAERSNYLVVPGSVALGAHGNLLSPANIALIEQIDDLYAKYKSGAMTEGQYGYQRRLRLDQFRSNIGPMERWLFGNQTPHQAIRIARGGGVPANQNIIQHANRLKKLASYGKYGGYLLTGVGVAASCMQIAGTDSRQEKNEIFVETVASTGVGIVGGLAVGLFLVSNPVGWGTALVLAAGSAAVSYGAGRFFRGAYTIHGNEVDFVSGMGVDSVCR